MDGNREKSVRPWILYASTILITIALSLSREVVSQELTDPDYDDYPAPSTYLNQLIYNRLADLTTAFKEDITKDFGFCINDVNTDWNRAFNFSREPQFLTNCARQSKGDMMQRICTAAEVKFYFLSFYESSTKRKDNYLKPNKNCNLTSWVSGCEPGWTCSSGKNQKVDLRNTNIVPTRTEACAPCCEGFFCPRGITCMIPCPLGAYCPLGELDKTTGFCDPYRYQLPPGNTNHTCGGADVWADIGSSREVFCSAGSYCPSTIQKNPCSKGHYCRTGSTAQMGCFEFATCDPQSENQNITAYGIMFFAGLTFLLIIIYNCSDQVLATRERRQAKSREKAVQSVRENAQAREKWKAAKGMAKKQVSGLQSTLSRTFSRIKSSKQPDLRRGLSQGKRGTDATLPTFSVDTSESDQSGPSKGKKKEKSNLTKMLYDIENNPDSSEGFDLEIGDKNIKKNAPRGKALHTQSQFFRYAYGQIEKEKAMQEHNSNLTFSGVISMANDTEIRKRPTIEVSFKDLTITLKGKNKHLLRSVTGKLSPGRVSAVMGPSGAGKTTFLSALTGKAPGCTMSGTVLINEKIESIRSYKKIIGFVPQDDIVHGNLTVEENLWFSARCRLSADLPKQDKVLVVERVIESLGLQPVRDSLIGTVEKRGISGGQRKRVNVGLEMVMEPSLLILDEPTSGLDSSSSQLLLRALRRDALEGVNICMVVHQPRVGKQRLREARTQAVDYLILLLAGICLGTIAKVSDDTFGASGYTYTVISVSLLSKIAALRSFSLDKLHYWRERGAGMSSMAYFLAKDTVDHFNTIVKPLVYLSMFYFFNNPRSSFLDNYLVLLCLVYCVTGIAYGLAIFLHPGPAQLWSVLLPVVLTLIATNTNKNNKFLDMLADLCYAKWALEAFIVSNAKRYYGVWLITRCGLLLENGYDLKHYNYCLLYLILTGILSRSVAFFCMVAFKKK